VVALSFCARGAVLPACAGLSKGGPLPGPGVLFKGGALATKAANSGTRPRVRQRGRPLNQRIAFDRLSTQKNSSRALGSFRRVSLDVRLFLQAAT
jgi:hypothetical protein